MRPHAKQPATLCRAIATFMYLQRTIVVTLFLLLGTISISVSAPDMLCPAVADNPPSISIEKQDASDNTSEDGQIHVRVTGGAAPYLIKCYGPGITSEEDNNRGQITLKNLKPGKYLIVARDQEGMVTHTTVTVKGER